MPDIPQQSATVGLEPGTLVRVGHHAPEHVRATVIHYDEHQFTEREIDFRTECPVIPRDGGVTWVNVIGVTREDILVSLGECFGLHRLVLEDMMNSNQRVKIEDFLDYLYLVVKVIEWDDERNEAVEEQVSLILGRGFVISIQETDPDLFRPIRDRLAENRSRARTMGADFLAYTLLDTVVDRYFVTLEALGDQIETMEDEVVDNPSTRLLQRIHYVKREMIFLRKATWPLREVVGALERRETLLIGESLAPYLRDLYDHTIQVIDTTEALRDIAAGLLDIYLSGVSNRLNVVMKLLAIIGTIFMPLTFIAGIYGMNFEHMPGLTSRWGYPLVLTIMAGIALYMIGVFRKKDWL
jgi:magnesium transporter